MQNLCARAHVHKAQAQGAGSLSGGQGRLRSAFAKVIRADEVLPHSTSETVEIVLVGDFSRAHDLIDWKLVLLSYSNQSHFTQKTVILDQFWRKR